jgi:hypothetical protein
MKVVGCKVTNSTFDKINSLSISKSEFLRLGIQLAFEELKFRKLVEELGDVDMESLTEEIKELTKDVDENLKNINLDDL